jgi:hypothetical protein
LLVLSPLALAVPVITTNYAKATSDGRRQQEIRFEERLEAEQRLSNLGYWTGPVDGNFDSASKHALTAFQKVEGRERTGKLTPVELQVLRTAVKPVPRDIDTAHVEIDIRRQVLFIVSDDGSITHILPVCTGNEKLYMDHGQIHQAHTPRGEFRVLRKIAGWRLSSLGLLYYPSYIREGVAIHGSPAMSGVPRQSRMYSYTDVCSEGVQSVGTCGYESNRL